MRLKIDRAPAVDPAPNTTAPTKHVISTSETLIQDAFGLVLGGSSVTVQPWVFSEQLDRWFTIGSTIACLDDELIDLIPLPRNSRVFFQITAVAGGETRLGIGVT